MAANFFGWVVILLLFVPVILDHRVFDGPTMTKALLAFVAFCCAASSAFWRSISAAWTIFSFSMLAASISRRFAISAPASRCGVTPSVGRGSP